MMNLSILLTLAVIVPLSITEAFRKRTHETHDYYALQLRADARPHNVAAALGLDYEGRLGELTNHYTFSSPKNRRHSADSILEDVKRQRLRRAVDEQSPLRDIVWHQKQKLKPRMVKRSVITLNGARQQDSSQSSSKVVGEAESAVIAKSESQESDTNQEAVAERADVQRELGIGDPIFGEQWHLFNTVQLGHDINVTGVWQQGITGEGATAVMVDDGIDMYSDDLKDNYFAQGSYDFNDNTDEPRPRLSDDRHGTRCAGEIAAVKNEVCGVGVAYNARIGGIRILSKVIGDEDEATAMNYKFQDNQIYSCSWGPPDDGRSMDAPGLLIRKALVNAVQNGRQGKGNIFVFAAGNGNNAGDNCNFDGYTNSIYTVTIGGIDRNGMHPYYSEHCSAQLAVTYSSGAGDAIHTTDVGTNKCYANHGGTSAAAPLGAGIIALAFSARPELSWRDVQNLCVLTSVPINLDDEWQRTAIGRHFSHVFGYGKLDAYALVMKAKEIDLLKPQAWFMSPWIHVNHPVPQGVEGLLSDFEVTSEFLKKANMEKVEHVTVTMNVEHTRRGDISVELRSPTNVVSHLSVARRLDEASEGYVDWTFMSMAHWGENGIGKWSVIVKDTNVNEHNGSFTDWRLTLWGECIDPSTQDLLPMPTENDDDDSETIIASPTFVSVHPGQTDMPTPSPNPTDHQDRPINAKPDVTRASSSTSADATKTADIIDLPNTPEEEKEHLLPHYFPTFGVSKRTQIWIYGAAVFIILFCCGLMIYFLLVRYKRRSNEREDYEFEVLDDDDIPNGVVGGKRLRRRAGELYDAFAGESDEEQLLSEEEEEEGGAYHDAPPDSSSDQGIYRRRDEKDEKQ